MRSVIVCGGGMAGLTAAASAARAGAQVTLLEKGPDVGGSARMSSGFVWTHRDLDELSVAIPRGNPALQALVVDTFAASVHWLKEVGVTIGAERHILDYGHGWQVDPVELCGVLRSEIVGHGGSVVTSCSLHRLVLEDLAVVGVESISNGVSELRTADSVVIATGGFQGNTELLGRYCVPSAANVYHRSNPWSTGDGFLAATEAGAATSDGLEAFYGHAMLAPPARLTPADFPEVTQYQGMFSVALNLDGVRFVDETLGTGEEVLNQALARQREGRGVYVVDARGADRFCLPPDLLSTSVVLERALARGAAVRTDSIAELAAAVAAFDVDPDAAHSTLLDFNDAMRDGSRLRPSRLRFRDPLDEAPFYAVSVKAAITFTMGGLAVDNRMRVLRRSTSSSPLAELIRDMDEYRPEPIVGLYAAGCDVGAISNVGYMGGLATALTTGRVAGSEAAESKDMA